MVTPDVGENIFTGLNSDLAGISSTLGNRAGGCREREDCEVVVDLSLEHVGFEYQAAVAEVSLHFLCSPLESAPVL